MQTLEKYDHAWKRRDRLARIIIITSKNGVQRLDSQMITSLQLIIPFTAREFTCLFFEKAPRYVVIQQENESTNDFWTWMLLAAPTSLLSSLRIVSRAGNKSYTSKFFIHRKLKNKINSNMIDLNIFKFELDLDIHIEVWVQIRNTVNTVKVCESKSACTIIFALQTYTSLTWGGLMLIVGLPHVMRVYNLLTRVYSKQSQFVNI